MVVCALNQAKYAAVGDVCPEGHFVVGKLDAIDGPLRDAYNPGGSIQFLGITPFVQQAYPSVRTGSSVFFSLMTNQTVHARVVDFAGEMHLGTVRKDTADLLDTRPRPPNLPVVPANLVLDMPRFQRSIFMDTTASSLYAITKTTELQVLSIFVILFHWQVLSNACGREAGSPLLLLSVVPFFVQRLTFVNRNCATSTGSP